MPIAALRHVCKTYWMGTNRVDALRDVNLEIERGDMIAIRGPSGSGKSTLLNVLGCLDTPSSGEYLLNGRDVAELDDRELSAVRATQIGFVFQSYHLIAQLTVLENIEVPLTYRGLSERESRERAMELAELVGLHHRLQHLPAELSGGECQRVAVARALSGRPLLILADEPTGNLDSRTGAEILELIGSLNQQGSTIILVTHDPSVAGIARRQLLMVDGQLSADEPQDMEHVQHR